MPDPLLLGGVAVDNPIWLAPLAGISVRSFREFHRDQGAGLVHTEMVSAIGLQYKNRKTRDLLGDESEKGPIVLQLFAPEAESLLRGAELALTTRSFDAIEINMACPMPKVTKRGCGANLISQPEKARQMTSSLAALGLPVWVKTRICDKKVHSQTTLDFCRGLADSGASLIMLHGRTPAERYEGRACRSSVMEVAAHLPLPLVASGDYYSPGDAEEYLAGGCAGVLAARGVLRDAFLIPKTLARLGYTVPQRLASPGFADEIEALLRIGRAGMGREGESFALVLVRRMLGGLLKGFHGAAAIRSSCAAARRWSELETKLLNLQEEFITVYDNMCL